MKLYRLINEYPGLPKGFKTGLVVIAAEGDKSYVPINGTADPFELISNTIVENYPAVWTQVLPATEYEILEFTDKQNVKRTLGEYGGYYANPDDRFSLNYALVNASITSVKRIKDNKVFSVGDRIVVNHKVKIIDGITLSDNAIVQVVCQTLNDPSKVLHFLGELTPTAKSIGKSEDGVDLHAGSKVFAVDLRDFSMRGTTLGPHASVETAKGNHVTWFVDKAKALEWLEDNTPIFSMAELRELLPTLYGTLDKLKKKAQEKRK